MINFGVVSDAYASEYERNATQRRCRIVNVKQKLPKWLRNKPLPVTTLRPNLAWQSPMPVCGCRGACGNVACPHRLTATC